MDRQHHQIAWTDNAPRCSCGQYELPEELRGPDINAQVEDWMKHTHATRLY